MLASCNWASALWLQQHSESAFLGHPVWSWWKHLISAEPAVRGTGVIVSWENLEDRARRWKEFREWNFQQKKKLLWKLFVKYGHDKSPHGMYKKNSLLCQLIESLGFKFVDVSLFLWVNIIKKKNPFVYRAHKVLSTRHRIVQKGNLICVKKKTSNCDPKKFETNKLKKW